MTSLARYESILIDHNKVIGPQYLSKSRRHVSRGGTLLRKYVISSNGSKSCVEQITPS